MSLGKIELKRNVDLKKYTTIKIGGCAKNFFIVRDPEELSAVIGDTGPDFYMLGGGSNLLIEADLIEKPVIKLAQNFTYIKESDNCWKIGASTPLSFLIKYCISNNLSGLEGLAGVPATVGGLTFMNASSFGSSIASCLREVEVMERRGEFKILTREEIVFDYRSSSLSDCVILGGKFSFSKEINLKQKVAFCLRKRLCFQDFNFPSCGCIFKNPDRFSAGFLIDSCGLKGLRQGDAQISPKHANFIINLGSATYQDVNYLIAKIKDSVYKKYNVILEEEIKRWN